MTIDLEMVASDAAQAVMGLQRKPRIDKLNAEQILSLAIAVQSAQVLYEAIQSRGSIHADHAWVVDLGKALESFK